MMTKGRKRLWRTGRRRGIFEGVTALRRCGVKALWLNGKSALIQIPSPGGVRGG
jgi:hypothetical protein